MKWEYISIDQNWIKSKKEELNLPDYILKLLYNRGLYETEDINRFLANDLKGFRNPFDFERMEEAVDRILKIRENRETLYIYGSYRDWETDRKSTRLNSSHITRSRMPSSA